MQEGFLFDDNDPKQLGHGVDVLHQNGDGLKADWKWTRGRGAGMPDTNRRCVGQTSEAEIGGNILLQAIFWHSYYEAEVYWINNEIASYAIDPRDNDDRPPLLTRVDAQRKAEELARQFVKDFSQELTTVGL